MYFLQHLSAFCLHRQCVEKLKSADTSFRLQLDQKEAKCQEQISRLVVEKQEEVELANKKVKNREKMDLGPTQLARVELELCVL